MKRLAVWLAVSSMTFPAHAQVSSSQVPAEVDASNVAAWWRPLVVAGGKDLVAFNAPGTSNTTHQVRVAIRTGTGAWSIGNLRNTDGSAWEHPDDSGHDQPTMAVDGNGYIHVWADHHGTSWNYFRSSAPNDVSNLRRIPSGATGSMPGSVKITYPVAERAPNGDIYLMVRNQPVNQTGEGELYRWNVASNIWSKIGTFAKEDGNLVYPDDLQIDANGNVHLAFEWAYRQARGLRHYGSYIRYLPATGVWETANGTDVTLPANRATPNLLYQGLSTGEVWNTLSDTGIGIQAAGMTIDPNTNRPSIAYRYRTTDGTGDKDFDIFRVRWNGSAWADKITIFTANNNTNGAVETLHRGNRARVYFSVVGSGLMAADSNDGWTVKAILPSQPGVERLSSVGRGGTDQDVIYAVAPTQIDAQRGRLYVVNVGAALP